ncbi:MAG: nucleoside deaminase [Clostridiales bacterium]|nr:nucleoside deaminase [Clostridiales bacterium]
MTHEDYMREALALARSCLPDGDVPVGCVVVSPEGEIIGRGRNRREAAGRATAHAEVEAIDQACAAMHSWRLADCTLYVTLEPCPMCAGAIINSRIGAVRYGAREDKSGCCGSVLNLFEERFNHRPRVYGGLLEAECRGLLEEFFQNLRKI